MYVEEKDFFPNNTSNYDKQIHTPADFAEHIILYFKNTQNNVMRF